MVIIGYFPLISSCALFLNDVYMFSFLYREPADFCRWFTLVRIHTTIGKQSCADATMSVMALTVEIAEEEAAAAGTLVFIVYVPLFI